MASLGKTESPMVQRTFQKREYNIQARTSLLWGSLNLIAALLMYLELIYSLVSSWFGLDNTVVWYVVCGLACLFTFNTIVDGFRYISCLSSGVVELSESQIKLLGVNNNDIGFRKMLPRMSETPNAGTGPILSPSKFCPMSSFNAFPSPNHSPTGSTGQYSPHGSLSPSPHKSSSLQGSPSILTPSGSLIQTPGRTTPSQSGSFLAGNYINQSLSQSLGPGQLGTSFSASFNRSLTGSTPSHSPMLRDSLADSTGLRSRFHNNSLKTSPGQTDGQIKDMRDLNQYLKEQEEKDSRAHLSSLDNSATGGQSFWSFNRSVSDFSPMLRKYQYQIACRSPQSAKAKSDEGEEGPAQYEADEVWLKVGALMDEVDLWVEQLRKWLGKTIFSRLHSEISKINKTLGNIGCEDMEIGEVGISTLKQLAMTKSQHLPTLGSLIPFLEITSNQEYLVQRILGSGGCVSSYRWQSGGDYKGKPWDQYLPTDAALVIHALCTYMDNRLPPHPKFPDGKTFTSQYFLKTPDKPNLEKKDNLFIYQTKINPPHFKVVIGDDIWNLPKGRNNLFHAILLFLHHIKTKEHGMLGKVNLGLSGINILWILDSGS